MKANTASSTLAITTKIVLPNDTNTLGNLFGGQLLAWMDVIASVSAHRHSKRVVVTASVNNVSFQKPINHASIVTLEAKVSKGTYIRSLIVDIAKELGTIATMTKLHRVESDGFHIDQAIEIDNYK